MMSILFLLVGLGLILSGANFLTDGAAALAKRFNKIGRASCRERV